MVARTSPDCLPYLEGTDSLCVDTGVVCEPSTVWCDFAEAVEDKLDQFDQAVAVVQNPPIAWVETLVPMTILVAALQDTQVVFDTVRADSANMVNLDENPSAITIPRSGLYDVFLYCRATTELAVSTNLNSLAMSLTSSPSAPPEHPNSYVALGCDQAINLDGVQIAPNIHMVTYLTEGQELNAFLNASGVDTDSDITAKISMGVAWLGDLL